MLFIFVSRNKKRKKKYLEDKKKEKRKSKKKVEAAHQVLELNVIEKEIAMIRNVIVDDLNQGKFPLHIF